MTNKGAIYQAEYNKLPNPSNIQEGASEFMRDSVVSSIQKAIMHRNTVEMTKFEKLLANL